MWNRRLLPKRVTLIRPVAVYEHISHSGPKGHTAMKSADPPDSAIRLCLATPQFYPTYGGAEQRYLRYLPGLSASGLDVTVFTGTATDEMITRGDALNVEWKAHPVGSVLPPEVINGSPVYRLRLPTRKGPHRRWMFSQRLDRFCRDPATRPDVVQLLGTVRIGTVPWVKRLQRLGIPTLYALTTASKIVRKKRFLDTGLMKFRALFSTMDAVVTNSASVGDALKEMGVSTRIEVIPNGVDIERFRPAPSREIHRSVRAELEIGAEAQLVIEVVPHCWTVWQRS